MARKDWGGRVRVALVYPNTYAVGMSNLGFQTIYDHLNALPHVVCERVFFPDAEDLDEYGRTGTPPFSLESQRPLTDFDLVGFSITYEGDYINTVRLLRMAGIPVRAADRGPGDPVIMMGGVCAFSNPEPVAAFMDVIVVGEGEEVVGEIVEAWTASGPADDGRRAPLRRAAQAPGRASTCPAPTGCAYGPDGPHRGRGRRSRPTCRRWWSSGGSRTSTASRRARRSRRPRPSTATWSCSRSARAAGEAAASVSKARSTGRCGTGASTRCASRWRASPRSRSGSGWWGPACPTIRGSAS